MRRLKSGTGDGSLRRPLPDRKLTRRSLRAQAVRGARPPADLERAKQQLIEYAGSEDFAARRRSLSSTAASPTRNRFFRRKTVADRSLLGRGRVRGARGDLDAGSGSRVSAPRRVRAKRSTPDRLLEILLHHLDRIEDDMRPRCAARASRSSPVQAAADPDPRSGGGSIDATRGSSSGCGSSTSARSPRSEDRRRSSEEIVTQAALNYLNKVFFLNLCEDRHLPGLLPDHARVPPDGEGRDVAGNRSRLPRAAAAADPRLGRRLEPEEERAYRALRTSSPPTIRDRVIEQNSWWELIRVAFDFAEEQFPLVYREDAYDYFRPGKETLAELVYDLSTKSFAGADEPSRRRHLPGSSLSLAGSSRRTSSAPSTRRTATSSTWSRS